MKHRLLKTLSLLLLFIATHLPLFAATTATVDGIKYSLNTASLTAAVGDNTSFVGDCVIPVSISYSGKTYRVTSISINAFRGCTGLTSVTIPNSVTTIGYIAFDGCTGLTAIDVDSDNPNYTSVDGVLYDKSVTELIQCPGAKTSATIPNSVTAIGDYAFDGCTGLTSVTIPNSVTSIGFSAFDGCTGLTSVTIPNSVTAIGSFAFRGCTGLTSVTIPNSVTTIGDYAFRCCTSLTSVTIGNSVTAISDYAFDGCTGLTSVTIPNSVTAIGDYAFRCCTSLTSVTIGNSVTTIGQSAFDGCTGLTAIDVDSDNPNYTSVDGVLYNKSVTGLIQCPSAKTSVTIPSSVTSIGTYAFSGCTGLTSVHINDIAAWCNIKFGFHSSNPLYYAHKLYLNGTEVTNLVIPNSVTAIGDYAFHSCTGLTSVTIPNSVTTIGSEAFYGCDVTSVYIDDIVAWCNIAFSNEFSNPLSKGSCSLYLSGTKVKRLVIPNSITSICSYAFYGCDVTSVVIPSSVRSIGDKAFGGSFGHTFVILGNRLFIGLSGYKFYVNESMLNDYKYNYERVYAVNSSTSTQTKIKLTSSVSDYLITEAEINGSAVTASGGAVEFDNLVPDKDYTVKYNITVYDQTCQGVTIIRTKPVDMSVAVVEKSSTSLTIKGACSVGDASYVSSGFENGSDVMTLYGLDPSTTTSYTYSVTTTEGGTIRKTISVTTDPLVLTTEPAQTISDTKAVITATTNGEDDATRFGFEWRRYDAPDLVPSSVAYCPVYDGQIGGTLHGLSPNTYYKYRPLYKSDSGKTYYGEWSAFGTADAYVYFTPTVHTLPPLSVSSTGATLRGHVTDGSDDTIEQGFEYWMAPGESSHYAAPSEIHTVTSSGMLMNASVGDLRPDTEYHFRSYAKTAKETTYGEELTFRTAQGVGGVEYFDADVSAPQIVGYYNMQGVRSGEPWPGLNIVVYSDGTTRKQLHR